MKIGNYPEVSLAEARVKLQELKKIRQEGLCPSSELTRKKDLEGRNERLAEIKGTFTIRDPVELYLRDYIEDRRTPYGKRIPGARKPKGQDETRRTMYGDVVATLGDKPAVTVTMSWGFQ